MWYTLCTAAGLPLPLLCVYYYWVSTPPILQTKTGKDALSITSMEWEQWIGQLWQKLQTRKYRARLPAGDTYKLAYDNAGVHQGANLRQFGIRQEDIVHVPALSSDMQKVVAHCHANLYHGMQKWLLKLEKQHRPDTPIAECKLQLNAVFENMAEEILKDVKSMLQSTDKA